MSNTFNSEEAVQVIKAGLQSGSIKLFGAVNRADDEMMRKMAQADATYLRELLRLMQEPLK
jgi:hypothetical protein